MRKRFSIAFAGSALVLADCQSNPNSSHPKFEPVAPVASSERSVSPARRTESAPNAVEVSPSTLPSPPPGTDPERVRFAASICAAAYLPSQKGGAPDVGCRSHPPFTRPEQKPDGKIPLHQGDPLSFCAIDRIFKGSFTRAGANQAVVSFAPCKDGDEFWDMAQPGSGVVVEDTAGRLRIVEDEPAINLEACKQVRRADGHDMLVCRSNFGAFGLGRMIYFFAIDFARTGDGHAYTIGRVFEDDLFCGEQPRGDLAKDGLVSIRIASESLADLNADGTLDYAVEIVRARAAPSQALAAKTVALCKSGKVDEMDAVLPPGTKHRLEFVSDQSGFAPTAATKRLLDGWVSERPRGFGGIETAGPPNR